MDDLLSLTRDDINSEFKDFDFPERKSFGYLLRSNKNVLRVHPNGNLLFIYFAFANFHWVFATAF